MKRLLLTISTILTLFASNVQGQSTRLFTQYFINPELFNPSFTGTGQYLDLKFIRRNQWTGVNGAPIANYVGMNWQISKKLPENFKSYSLRISQPNAFDSIGNVKFSYGDRIKHGVGINVLNTSEFAIRSNNIFINYAIHLPVKRNFITIGIAPGIVAQNTDVSSITLRNPDDDLLYQELLANGGRRSYMTMKAGLMFWGSKFKLAYAAENLYNVSINELSTQSAENNSITHHMNFMYALSINDKHAIVPAIYYRTTNELERNLDISLLFRYDQLAYAGLTYRDDKAFAIMGGGYINNLFFIGYSYDFATSTIKQFDSGSHEIVLSFTFVKRNLKLPYLP